MSENQENQSYAPLYWESTQDTMRTQYSKREITTEGKLEPVETPDQIINRVAQAVAMSELRYCEEPIAILDMTLEKALAHPKVSATAAVFADQIGNQRFWANTPANINADPSISLKVLQYEALGRLANIDEGDIWLNVQEYMDRYKQNGAKDPVNYIERMGKLATELHGKGCLAACGVAYIEDTLESIQEAARIESIATRSSMGMGLNTSKLRPWNTPTSIGAAASGPDRFYEKTISKAVEAVAQGGRRGGALIELRDSDHPDILFFIDKKKLVPKPDFTQMLGEVMKSNPDKTEDANVAIAEDMFGKAYAQFLDQQKYLKNTNVTVLAKPGFMEAVVEAAWYRVTFNGKDWDGPVYDPRSAKGGINKYTKEIEYETYKVDLKKYPKAEVEAKTGFLYAPEVFDRIVENMRDSGEPGIMFYDLVNDRNPNSHIYDLNTCNPCGEQLLPAGRGKRGELFLGTCNLSSLHAAHPDFWNLDGSYNFSKMSEIVQIQQHFMDNVTDVSWYPIPQQNWTARFERRNGGGFAGIAEYLSRLGHRFGGKAANAATKELFKSYTSASLKASTKLAQERGCYALWKGSEFESRNIKIRNACLVNNAPTGTLAQMMQTSWGVDPHNGIVFSRKVRTAVIDFVAPGFKDVMVACGAWPQTELGERGLYEAIRKNKKSVQGLSQVPAHIQDAFPVRVEVSPTEYIEHLAACYAGANAVLDGLVMNSISNTCSIPEKYDPAEIRSSLVLAWQTGVKALTFYPDGARLSQPVEQIGETDEVKEKFSLRSLIAPVQAVPTVQAPQIVRRVVEIDETEGISYKVRVGAEVGLKTLHVSLNHEPGRSGELIEIYARMGKTAETGPFEAIGRLASAFLQFAAQFGENQRRIAEDTIVKQLLNIQNGHAAFHTFSGEKKASIILSTVDGIAKSIQQYRKAHPYQGLDQDHPPLTIEREKVVSLVRENASEAACPNCSRPLMKIEGCWNCQECAYSKC